MSNEMFVALVAAILTFVFGLATIVVNNRLQSSKSIKKAKTYVVDEFSIIEHILKEIDSVLSNTNTLPNDKVRSLQRFSFPSEALKSQIVELPDDELRRKINIFYNDLFNATSSDFSAVYSLNEHDQVYLNVINEIKSKFKDLLRLLEEIKTKLKY